MILDNIKIVKDNLIELEILLKWAIERVLWCIILNQLKRNIESSY
jgi:hypothetical protein